MSLIPNSEAHQRKYIPSKLNPADHINRGTSIPDFLELDDWSHGPSFLKQTEDLWPVQLGNEKTDVNFEILNSSKRLISKATKGDTPTDKLINSVSDWFKLKRRLAWILRLKEVLRTKSTRQEPISVRELHEAEIAIAAYIQSSEYSELWTHIRNVELSKGATSCTN